MNKLTSILFFLIIISFASCTDKQETTDNTGVEANSAAEGFDVVGSDEKAIKIADEVMEAIGGRQNWDNTRFLTWTFPFGNETIYWDKKKGDVRIEQPKTSTVLLWNVFTNEGNAKVGDEELTNPDSLAKYNKIAKETWINNSYWLVMPFKLKDSGVTLKYLRADTTSVGDQADVLELTFKNVGVTPKNRYEIFVDVKTKLVTQWDFYTQMTDKKARFKFPWANYQTYGKIKLSDNRGKYNLTNVAVYDEMNEAVFTDFAPVDMGMVQ